MNFWRSVLVAVHEDETMGDVNSLLFFFIYLKVRCKDIGRINEDQNFFFSKIKFLCVIIILLFVGWEKNAFG